MNAREIAETFIRKMNDRELEYDVLYHRPYDMFKLVSKGCDLAQAYLALESRVDVLEEALKFYANKGVWEKTIEGHDSPSIESAAICYDNGERARKALAEGGEK